METQELITKIIKKREILIKWIMYSGKITREDAEDIFATSETKALEKMNIGGEKSYGWFTTIIHNEKMNFFRKRKTKQYMNIDKLFNSSNHNHKNQEGDQDDYLHHELETQESVMIKAEVYEQLGRIIEKLPVVKRDILNARIYQGMSFKDIAEERGISINTALGRMRYALIEIRKHL